MSFADYIILNKFIGGQLKGITRSYSIKRDIIIRIDVFTGKERICWDCGGTRMLCVILNIRGYPIEFDEECVKKDHKIYFWFTRRWWKTIRLLKYWKTSLIEQLRL